jgi:hypothetical protein
MARRKRKEPTGPMVDDAGRILTDAEVAANAPMGFPGGNRRQTLAEMRAARLAPKQSTPYTAFGSELQKVLNHITLMVDNLSRAIITQALIATGDYHVSVGTGANGEMVVDLKQKKPVRRKAKLNRKRRS